MKKTLTVMSLVLLVAGAAFAGVDGDRLFVQPNATFSSTTGLTGGTGNYTNGLLSGPSTTNNDDSCDISVMPAATLLLPYFEVDIASPSSDARNTIFTITNVTEQPQIAHVTIWTDWSFPVIDFNLWLTGYDVVPVSLYDILRNGQIPPTGYTLSNVGAFSEGVKTTSGNAADTGNPNHNRAEIVAVGTGCAALPGPIPPTLLARIQTALTTGVYGTTCPAATPAGGTNAVATGYITIDVADSCSQLLPDDPNFFLNDILWDNSLIGDYMIINSSTAAGNFAGGNPMVHIRAIPEGGPFANAHLGTPDFSGGAGTITAARANVVANTDLGLLEINFQFTFYDRYSRGTAPEGLDRRQPLPGRFAARFIQDQPTGPTGFETNLIIWREGGGTGQQTCTGAGRTTLMNDANPAAAVVRFDEQENPNINIEECQISPCEIDEFSTNFEETQAVLSSGSKFPEDNTATADLGGWLYLDLNGFETTSTLAGERLNHDAQAWVAIQMFAEGRYSVLYDAAMLENGCTPALATAAAESEDAIRPGPNVVP